MIRKTIATKPAEQLGAVFFHLTTVQFQPIWLLLFKNNPHKVLQLSQRSCVLRLAKQFSLAKQLRWKNFLKNMNYLIYCKDRARFLLCGVFPVGLPGRSLAQEAPHTNTWCCWPQWLMCREEKSQMAQNCVIWIIYKHQEPCSFHAATLETAKGGEEI